MNKTMAIVVLAAGLCAAPALASGSPGGATSVPEPTDAVLLLMGVAGVVVGRRLHARKDRD